MRVQRKQGPAVHLDFKFAEGDEARTAMLSEPYQEVLLLSKTMGTKSIGEALGMPHGTAKSRLHRARSALVALRKAEDAQAGGAV